MPPVEQRPPPAGNPGASRYVRHCCRGRLPPQHGADANDAIAVRVPGDRARSAGSAARSGAVPRPGPGAGRPARSSGCHGHSSCTARPGCGIARTGTGGRVGPCAPRHNRSAGRTRPKRATLLWHRLHRHGVGRGTVVKLAGSQTAAAPTFFGIDRVVPRRAHSDVQRHRRRATPTSRPSASPTRPRAPLRCPRPPGRPAGRPGGRLPPSRPSHARRDAVRLNQPWIKTAASPANSGGS